MILKDAVLTSTLLEVQHGFTTRGCGNLGFGKNPGDPDVIRNRQRLFERTGLARLKHIQTRQVHSDISINAADFVPGCEADACYTDKPDELLSVLTADCVPVLVHHPVGLVAVIHAGWRGLFNEIIPKTLAKLPAGPLVAIGPAIGGCCYEVGEDLATAFAEKFGENVIDRTKAKPHLDLTAVAIHQLMKAGAGEIDVAHLCTACHPDLFYSYRREGSSGRMMSYINLSL